MPDSSTLGTFGTKLNTTSQSISRMGVGKELCIKACSCSSAKHNPLIPSTSNVSILYFLNISCTGLFFLQGVRLAILTKLTTPSILSQNSITFLGFFDFLSCFLEKELLSPNMRGTMTF